MNRKQFIILLVLLAVVGAAGWIAHQRGNQSWQSAASSLGGKLLPKLAVNDIAQITIQSGTNELHLARRDNLWRVRERDNYPANFSQISSLLLKLADLKIIQTEDVEPSQLGQFHLLPPGAGTNTATRIAFKDQSGKTLDTLLLGKQHLQQPTGNSQFGGMGSEGYPDGRYVMVGAGAKTVDVISDPLDDVQTQPTQWLNKQFVSIENPRLITVQFPQATNSWELTRASTTNEWQLADAKPEEKLDRSKISSVTSPFSSASFNDVAPLKPGGTAKDTVLKVKTFDGVTYVANIAPKDGDNYPVSLSISANLPTEPAPAKDEKPADKAKLEKAFKTKQTQLKATLAREEQCTNWVYQVPSYVVEPILKTRGQLLAAVETNAPAKSEK